MIRSLGPKLKDIKEGDWLLTDYGFTCVKGNVAVKIHSCKAGLFFNCTGGTHFLEGQTNENGCLIGLTHTVPCADKIE